MSIFNLDSQEEVDEARTPKRPAIYYCGLQM